MLTRDGCRGGERKSILSYAYIIKAGNVFRRDTGTPYMSHVESVSVSRDLVILRLSHYVSREGTGFIHESSAGRRFYRRAFRFSGLSNRFRLSKLHRNRCQCPRFCRGVINQHLLIPTRARGGPRGRCRLTACKKHGDCANSSG